MIEGPYRISRHPIYLGMAMILIAVAVLAGSVTPLLVVPLFVGIMATWFVPAEEKMLEETFGQEYLDYKKRVRCWP